MEPDGLERLLHGDQLEHKLTPLIAVTPCPVPVFPGRPVGLQRPPAHRKLPSLRGKDVEHDEGRRRILHELANHELQAIELLGLALARWPDAPEGLRKGFLSTLHDEQKHCRLYLERLAALGGSFGEVPVSTFFWDTLHGVDTIEGFIAGLSLCFEAANLDFANTWRQRFAQAGDQATADVLQTVLDDEIRHVSLGLAWFTHTAGSEEDVVDAWQRALPAPLTPAHARGTVFNGPARRRAGFRPEQIRRLELLGGHRSKAPQVRAFDAAVEDRVVGRTPTANTLRINAHLAHLPLFLGDTADLVRAPVPPDDFLEPLADAGFALPRFDPDASVDTPWGETPASPSWKPSFAALSNKTATLLHLQTLPRHPLWVEDLGQIWAGIPAPSAGPWVIKAPFSASGSLRIQGEGPLTEANVRWCERQLRSHGRLLCMPWYERVADVSVHLTVGEQLKIDGITRFHTVRGRFLGAWPTPWIQTFDVEKRWLHGNGDRTMAFEPALLEVAEQAGAWAQELGYTGPLSLDALIVRTSEGLRLHPWLETNARNTLGRVALAMRERIHPRSTAFWHVGRPSETPQPVVLEGGRIRSGTLRTTPDTALPTWLEVRAEGPAPH